MKKAANKLLSLALAFSIVVSLAITTTFASTGILSITLPEDVYGTNPKVTVSVYAGMPTSSSIRSERISSISPTDAPWPPALSSRELQVLNSLLAMKSN